MRRSMTLITAGLTAVALVGLGTVSTAAFQGAAPAPLAGSASSGLVFRGTVDFAALAAQARMKPPAASKPTVQKNAVGRANLGAAPAVAVPNPPSTPVAAGAGGATGFVALTVEQQAVANNGATLEPPDQGLCAHAGQVMEPVNIALQIFTEAGAALSPPVSLNDFFALPPTFNPSNNTAGPFLSDPRCYFDAQTGRWFVTVLEIDVNPYSGRLAYRSAELLAVSQTSDPLGHYGLFMIDSTNDGLNHTMALPNCPCFGDQPRIGADANGFYISVDSYPIHGLFNSNGGEIWALSKRGLAKAASGKQPAPALVTLYNGATIIGGYPANAVQPAITPEGGKYAPDREYFLSTPDFNGFATSGGVGASSIVLWTLAGTSTLDTPTPSVTMTNRVIPSEPYAPPANAAQKAGPLPLGDSVGASLPPISVNDDRMQQVEYTGGLLFSALNTGVGPSNTANRSGVAWFVVKPGAGIMANNGYVAIGGGASLMYPAIGLAPTTNGVMTFSVSGPNRYPSHAYMAWSSLQPYGSIFIDGPGTAPEDGFTCYSATGFGPACRWGDYSAASSDGAGNIVMGTEMIPNTTRTPDSNWGTYISVRPA